VTALLWSFLYVGLIVAIGEGARRLGLARSLARKLIHVGVGLWIWGTLALFDSPLLAAIPPLAATVGNAVIHRFQLLKSVEAAPENLGTIWFPISFAGLILLLGDKPHAVAAGIMAMTLGDAAASLFGERFGRHPYRIGRATKSVEGSHVMLLVSFLAILGTLWAFASGAFVPRMASSLFGAAVQTDPLGPALIGLALLAALYAMCAEAAGSRGLDNLTVPVGVALLIAYVPPGAALPLGFGALLALVIGEAAYQRGSLSASGVGGAVLTGTLLFGLAGAVGAAGLLAFFLSSSLLSGRFKAAKKQVEEDYAKGGTRDFGQALANGGVAALAALLLALTGNLRWLGALIGALAAANADTWATELGVLARRAPRLITTGQVVPKGTSGGVTAFGLLASAGGALLVGLAVAMAAMLPGAPFPSRSLSSFLPGAVAAGLVGSLCDSLLGATGQAIYWCPTCGRETERTVHACGTTTQLRRGLPWVGNDLVNGLATACGALVGYLLFV
jgi:uncharacterized protein (TIGR00297 family)